MAKKGRPSKYTIYTLSGSGGVRYVGQTTNPRKRFGQHCSLAQNRGDRRVNIWLRRMIQIGDLPTFTVLEVTSKPDERECFWISHFIAKGCRLLNMTPGGKDIRHMRTAKMQKPWAPAQSPVQRRLILLKQAANFFRRKGLDAKANEIESGLLLLNALIKDVGLDRANARLYAKYGH